MVKGVSLLGWANGGADCLKMGGPNGFVAGPNALKSSLVGREE